VVFTKLVSHRMHRLFRLFGRNNGQRFIYVTPYRPAESWPPESVRDSVHKKEVEELLTGFDLIVCQNEIFARDLRDLGYHGPLEMLPNLPPPSAPDPVPYPREGPLTLGFLGRLEHQKNLPEMLKVFSLLLAEAQKLPGGPRPLRLSLFGEGSLRAELEGRARELGIAAFVDFHGSIPRSRVRAAIQSCQLFLFTSHSEGQPIASLEILAEGRPIIATAVGAFPDMLVTPALGEVVPAGDTEAFTTTVKKMLARQAAGEVSPRDTIAAYEAGFDRERTLRRYIELISPASAVPELCTHSPETGSAV
jgi:glycosyltransferase involved in cell wall biosynthesis